MPSQHSCLFYYLFFYCDISCAPFQAFEKGGLRVDFSLSKPEALDPSKSAISISFSNTSAEVGHTNEPLLLSTAVNSKMFRSPHCSFFFPHAIHAFSWYSIVWCGAFALALFVRFAMRVSYALLSSGVLGVGGVAQKLCNCVVLPEGVRGLNDLGNEAAMTMA